MSEHEQTGSGTDAAPEGLAPLVAVDACGRLAVHAAAALEMGDTAQVMALLDEIARTCASTVEALGEAERATVRAQARAHVNPLIGWVPRAA